MTQLLHDDAARRAGRRHLRQADPRLGALVKKHGDIWPPRRTTAFGSLTATIVSQQISTAAAATIHRRIKERFGARPSATDFLRATDAQLKECGLSRQKIRYLRSLSEHVNRKALNLRRLPWLSDDDVVAQLTQVVGLGQWSAEMYLMFVLGRPDVLSTGDLGLQNGARDLYNLRDRPDAGAFTELAEAWRPYRSLASTYLWASVNPVGWQAR